MAGGGPGGTNGKCTPLLLPAPLPLPVPVPGALSALILLTCCNAAASPWQKTVRTTTTTGTETHSSLGKHPFRNTTRQRLLRPRTLRFRYARGVSSSPLQPVSASGSLRSRPVSVPSVPVPSPSPLLPAIAPNGIDDVGASIGLVTCHMPPFDLDSTLSSSSITTGVYRYWHVRMLGKAFRRGDPFQGSLATNPRARVGRGRWASQSRRLQEVV
jgi:hypothetical protein